MSYPTRRQREEREQRHEELLEQVKAEEAVLPSQFGILHLDDISPQDHPTMVALWRESTPKQDYKSQRGGLKHYLKEKGFEVVSSHGDVHHGASLEKEERPGLFKCVRVAKREGAVIVAIEFNRFLRSIHFSKNDPHAMPTREQIERLLEIAEGVPLVTIGHPDKHPADEALLRGIRKGL